jgi:ribosomal protein L37AE/L43A
MWLDFLTDFVSVLISRRRAKKKALREAEKTTCTRCGRTLTMAREQEAEPLCKDCSGKTPG